MSILTQQETDTQGLRISNRADLLAKIETEKLQAPSTLKRRLGQQSLKIDDAGSFEEAFQEFLGLLKEFAEDNEGIELESLQDAARESFELWVGDEVECSFEGLWGKTRLNAAMASEKPLPIPTEQFLRAFHPNGNITFQTFDDNKDRKSGTLAKIFNGSYADHEGSLKALNDKDAGVFFTVNHTDGNGRKKENIVGISALFCDFDNGDPDPSKLGLLPEPSIIVQSGGGKHYYWLAKTGEPLEAFTYAQKQLIDFLGSDNKVHDLPRVMRLPGFFHKKNPSNPFEIYILKFSELRYSISEVISCIPERSDVELPKVIAQAVKQVKAAKPGDRNNTLNKAAFNLGIKIGKGEIERDACIEPLTAAALSIGFLKDEALRVIEGGLNAGVEKVSTFPDDDNLLLSRGLLNGVKVPKPFVAMERAKHLYPDIKFDVLMGRWTVDGVNFLSTNKLADKLTGEFWREDWLGFAISKDSIVEALNAKQQAEEFCHNSRLEYFDALEWEPGTDAFLFLSEMLGKKALQVPTGFECLLLIKQLVGTVERVYVPGASVQRVSVIQSPKGHIGKSTFLEKLCPRKLTDFRELSAKDVLDPDEKRYIMKIEGSMMVVVNEIGQLTQAADHREATKEFTSRSVDTGIRMSGKEREDIPRGFTLWGTENEVKFLPAVAALDEAFKRRFFPIRTLATPEKMIDNPWVEKNRDLIWAAAKHLYETGFSSELSADELKKLSKHVTMFCNGNEVTEAVVSWMLDIHGSFAIGKRYLLRDISKAIYGNNAKRYQSEALKAWLVSDEAKALMWDCKPSKGNMWFSCKAKGQNELDKLISCDESDDTETSEPTKEVDPIEVLKDDLKVSIELKRNQSVSTTLRELKSKGFQGKELWSLLEAMPDYNYVMEVVSKHNPDLFEELDPLQPDRPF